ncbi:piggyBac transposable element-derived protein 4-like [Calliphora vicina]|uniref:piggyBac transposable element-derived protein 4-like n=1 Tax=Calliphora vicina TaxID=7373 RepID=UPI00325B52E9
MKNKNLQKWVSELLEDSEEEMLLDDDLTGYSSSNDTGDVSDDNGELGESDQEDSYQEDDDTLSTYIETYGNESDAIWHENTKSIPSFPFNESGGVCGEIQNDATPRMVFQKFFDEDIINLLTSSCNAYGKKLENNDTKPSTRKRPKIIFHETSKDEMLKFLGLCLLQGQNRKPSIKKMFSKNKLYYQLVFAAVMSGRRFQKILRCFSYHESYEQVKWTGKLEKVIPLLNLVLRSFRNNYRPNKELSLDESLMLFKGRLSFKQYNKGTRAKYGIKFYELTSNDGFILNAEIYAGKVIEDTIGSKTKTVVLKLMDSFLNRGHHLFMDNYYNSVKLSQTLLHYKTHTTGTLRFNRKPNPKCITTKKLKNGEMIWRRTGNVYVTKWKDKRDVLSITTAHHPCLIEVSNRRGQKQMKPIDVVAYNARKTIRWQGSRELHIKDVI